MLTLTEMIGDDSEAGLLYTLYCFRHLGAVLRICDKEVGVKNYRRGHKDQENVSTW